MRSRILQRASQRGSALLTVLIICSLLAMSVAFYLSFIEQQGMLSTRSQYWNVAMTVAEAGVEEGLEELNSNLTNPGADGWVASGVNYTISRALADGNSYSITLYLTNALSPVVFAQANIGLPSIALNGQGPIFAAIGVSANPTVVKRAVQVTCARPSLFTAAVVVKNNIDLAGNGVYSDSFDSSNTNKSTNGQYDASKYTGDHGDMVTNGGITNSVDVQNGNIYGTVHTGPGCPVSIGSNGGVGPHGGQTSDLNVAIQKGYVVRDANFTFPDTAYPDTTGYEVPAAGSNIITSSNYLSHVYYFTNSYNHVMYGGHKYVATSLSGTSAILKNIFTGETNVTLALPNGLNTVGNDSITLDRAANLLIYSGGTSFSASGNAVINQNGTAASFIVYCAPSVTSFSLAGNGTFTGILVAPNANVTLRGSGNNQQDYSGALVANSITLNGHFSFHYDESLGSTSSKGRYLITSWNEVTPH